MNIVRWLSSHPILSVWALTIVALLLSFGGAGGKKHGTEVAANHHATTQLASHQAGEGSVTTNHQTPNAATTEHNAVAEMHHQVQEVVSNLADLTHQAEQTVLATSASVVAQNNSQASKGDITHKSVADNTATAGQTTAPATTDKVTTEQVTTLVATDKPVTEQKTTIVVEETSSATATSPEHAIASTDLKDKSVDDLLLMAREAYWNNGLDEAASIYQELIQREPNVVEHKGELGNVYWRQGFPEKSAKLYADIAIPMIDKGNAERVSNMIGFIGLFYPDKATEINKHMQSIGK